MKRRMFGILVIGVLVVGMVGCGKQDVDYAASADGEITTCEVDAVQDSGVPMHVEENIVLQNGSSVIIDADVNNGANLGKMPVASLEIDRRDLAEIKAFAEKVFDDGSVERVIHASQEVNEEEDSFQWTVYRDEEDGSESFSICYAKGKIGEQFYGLNVREMDGNYTICLGQVEDDYHPVYFDSYGLSESRAVMPGASEEYLKNSCGLSKEEAVEQATEFVEGTGLKSFSVIGAFDARRTEESDEELDVAPMESTHGYIIYFGREINGFSTLCKGNYLGGDCYDTKADDGSELDIDAWVTYYGYECITVLVDEAGIVAFRYDNPMTVKEIAADNASVTEFGKIHEIAVGHMKEFAQNAGRDSIVTDLELSMVRVTYQDDTYAMVPAWVYSWKTGNDFLDEEQIVLVVNAIDGAIIDVQSGKILE